VLCNYLRFVPDYFNFSQLFCGDLKAAKRELGGGPLEFSVIQLMPQEFFARIRLPVLRNRSP
jgi:hypothetical protein